MIETGYLVCEITCTIVVISSGNQLWPYQLLQTIISRYTWLFRYSDLTSSWNILWLKHTWKNNKEISWVLQNKDSINTLSNWPQLNTGITFVYCPRIVIAKIFSSQTHQIYYSGSNLQHSRASTFIIFIVLSVEITFSNCEPARVKIIFFHFVKTCLQSVSYANGHILMVSTVHMVHCSDTNIHLQHSDTTEISTRKYFLC